MAKAADLEVVVRNGRGAPVPDAVVTVSPSRGGGPPSRYEQPLVMGQENQQFFPFVLIVPRGADVRFPNKDVVKHHVYSFSPAKRFQLALYGRDQSRSVRLDKTGVVALGCNIHDSMVAYIDVVDAPYAAKTDGTGRATFHALPAGPAQVRAWHPYMRAPDSTQTTVVDLPATGAAFTTFTAEMRIPVMRISGY